MVELVDTLVSGTSAFAGMEVQVFFRGKRLTRVRDESLELLGL